MFCGHAPLIVLRPSSESSRPTQRRCRRSQKSPSRAPRPVSYPAASALICRTLTNPPPCHCRTKEVYTKTFSWPTNYRAVSSLHGAVLLTRLLAHPLTPPLLKAYANQLDTTVDPYCPSCGGKPQTVEHWLQRFPNAEALRKQLFGEPSQPLSVLTTNPGSVLGKPFSKGPRRHVSTATTTTTTTTTTTKSAAARCMWCRRMHALH